MKSIFYFMILLFTSQCVYSQKFIQGTVADFKTHSALAFCNVVVKSKSYGTITNNEGVYKISIDSENDTLVFSYIGYITKTIPVRQLLDNADIVLESKGIGLKEVTVHSTNDYLYDIMEHCRKQILSEKQSASKVYFQLATEISEQPVEMLECYYNGYVKGSKIEKLLLKNGRIGLVESKDNGFFTSRNTTQVISDLSLTEQNDFLPSAPLQFGESKLKKNYSLQPVYDAGDTYHIKFIPNKKSSAFAGEVWIDKETYSILKINLDCENTSVHPFLPLFEGGSIDSVSISVSESYSMNKKGNHLSYINFEYQLKYNNGHSLTRLNNGSTMDYKVMTNGTLLLYDYEKLFLLPYFKYDASESDYRKITSMPYNESFWKSNEGLVLTARQKQTLQFFNVNGVLVNYKARAYGVKGNYNAFEDNNIVWSAQNRIALKANHLESILHKDSLLKPNGQNVPSDLYNLQVQIFLDINPSTDSTQHFSSTVLDVFKSYYNLPSDMYTDCFINIYFDICEIERRQMEKTISTQSWSVQQMDSIYQQTSISMDKISRTYFKEVQSGKNMRELKKWNDYVFHNLNIDNMHTLGLEIK